MSRSENRENWPKFRNGYCALNCYILRTVLPNATKFGTCTSNIVLMKIKTLILNNQIFKGVTRGRTTKSLHVLCNDEIRLKECTALMSLWGPYLHRNYLKLPEISTDNYDIHLVTVPWVEFAHYDCKLEIDVRVYPTTVSRKWVMRRVQFS